MESTQQLLRSHVEQDYEILESEIVIEVQKDLLTAKYTYAYIVKKLRENIKEEWREIFSYEKSDFSDVYAYPGWPAKKGTNETDGLSWNLDSLSSEVNKACLKVNIGDDRTKSEKDVSTFHYKVKTKIESLKKMGLFGGSGIVLYWTSQEYPCKILRIRFKLPPKLSIVDTMPPSVKDAEGFSIFEKRDLLPRQYVSALIRYEKKILGIPTKYYRAIEIALIIALSTLAAWGVQLLS